MVDWNDDLGTFKAKKKAMFSDELGKIGRAAERGKAVNKTQEKHGKYSEQQMYAKKMKDMPVKRKLAELGIGLTVTAATNPNLGRGIQRVFTGNPIDNVKDMVIRNRLMQVHKKAMLQTKKDYLEMAEKDLRELPDHPVFKTDDQKRNYFNNQLNNYKANFTSERLYEGAVSHTDEAMAQVQANRIMEKSMNKIIKEEVKKFKKESKQFFGNHNYRK